MNRFRKAANDERGVSILEYTIVLPIMLFLLYVVADVGMFLQSYFIMSHAVREGVKTASATPGLQEGTFVGSGGVADTAAGHMTVQNRVLNLMKNENLRFENGNTPDIISECLPSGQVSVRLSGNFGALFNFSLAQFVAQNMHFEVSEQSKYLFTSCAV